VSVSYRLDGRVAVLTLDDGKANALGHAALDALDAALDRAEAEADAVALLGRPGRFSAGFDLEVITSSTEAMRALVARGARTTMRLFGFPRPVVAGCTGHALAAGALLLLACDHRVGADGPFKLGLNEVTVGMPVPQWAVELARYRIPPSAFDTALLGRIYDPTGAVAAGFLDDIDAPEAIEEVTIAAAARYATLRRGAVAGTKQRARGAVVASILAGLDDDLATFRVEPAS
jgi:enoyl-CoA hydratase